MVLLAALVAAAGLATAEIAGRIVVQRRSVQLLHEVVTTRGTVVRLPARPLLLSLGRRVLTEVIINAREMELDGLGLVDVTLHLQDVELTRSARIAGGVGWLDGHLPSAEVLRLAGVPGAVELDRGTATFRWPAPRAGVPSIGLRMRPTLAGDRVRLAPTPISIAVPPLPRGVQLTSVEAEADALLVTADIDLAALFARP